MQKYVKTITTIAIFTACSTSMAIDRFIIKYKSNDTISDESVKPKQGSTPLLRKLSDSTINKLSRKSSQAGKEENQVRIVHTMATGAHIAVLDSHLDKDQAQDFIDSVREDDNVEYIEEDRILKITKLTAKTNPDWQWDMTTLGEFAPNSAWIGDNFVNAWKTLAKSDYLPGKNVIVAVVDTGYTPHSNFIKNLQTLNKKSETYGYQFISDCQISGECLVSKTSDTVIKYKENGLDLGDYTESEHSSWHGTHVTGTIIGSGYDSKNKYDIAGGAFAAKVVPVRVLGKNGGYTSDIVNGMLWAAGLPVLNTDGSLVAKNPHPAHVINLSLGGDGQCSKTQQKAIDAIIKNGVIVVAAAGNSATDVANSNPANCKGVISVAAKGPTNKLASYSNYGAITIAAAGGDQEVSSSNGGIYSTLWSSTSSYKPEQKNYGAWGAYQGTSMAAPHVSAAVAILIGALKAKGKKYTPNDISDTLQKTAEKYNNCNNNGCANSGALNVDAALQYIL